MIPGEFDYYAPTSLDEAVSLLSKHGDDAKILAGGQSLIPAMRYRLALPEILIDITGIDGMSYIREDNGHLAIGAMTTESELEDSELVQDGYDMLSDAAFVIADPVVRNKATVGGNIAHSDPANDHPAVMLAYGAEVICLGPGGTRSIPIDEFFTGLFENSLGDDEILTEIRVPRPAANSGTAYIKIERKVGDYAISAAAVNLVMDGDTVAGARIGLTNVSATPMRARNAEAAIIGKILTDDVLEAAGAAAGAECDPAADLRGTVEYKRDLTRVLVKRAIKKAASRAG
ncbi:MAG: xanthine dehydrogenase family protein subunit M [Chloroflexota bacterium]